MDNAPKKPDVPKRIRQKRTNTAINPIAKDIDVRFKDIQSGELILDLKNRNIFTRDEKNKIIPLGVSAINSVLSGTRVDIVYDNGVKRNMGGTIVPSSNGHGLTLAASNGFIKFESSRVLAGKYDVLTTDKNQIIDHEKLLPEKLVIRSNDRKSEKERKTEFNKHAFDKGKQYLMTTTGWEQYIPPPSTGGSSSSGSSVPEKIVKGDNSVDFEPVVKTNEVNVNVKALKSRKVSVKGTVKSGNATTTANLVSLEQDSKSFFNVVKVGDITSTLDFQGNDLKWNGSPFSNFIAGIIKKLPPSSKAETLAAKGSSVTKAEFTNTSLGLFSENQKSAITATVKRNPIGKLNQDAVIRKTLIAVAQSGDDSTITVGTRSANLDLNFKKLKVNGIDWEKSNFGKGGGSSAASDFAPKLAAKSKKDHTWLGWSDEPATLELNVPSMAEKVEFIINVDQGNEDPISLITIDESKDPSINIGDEFRDLKLVGEKVIIKGQEITSKTFERIHPTERLPDSLKANPIKDAAGKDYKRVDIKKLIGYVSNHAIKYGYDMTFSVLHDHICIPLAKGASVVTEKDKFRGYIHVSSKSSNKFEDPVIIFENIEGGNSVTIEGKGVGTNAQNIAFPVRKNGEPVK